MKKIVLIVLAIVTLSLVGCNKEEKTDSKVIEDTPTITDAGEYPIVKEKKTIKVLTISKPTLEDYKTNKFTEWFEEKTNVHIEWEVIPQESVEEKLNLILTSGDLPDVFLDIPISNSQLMAYGDSLFYPLNELIDKYGVETKRIFKEHPEVEQGITNPEGEIFALPEVNECFHCSMAQKMWVYEPWLDELDLEMPTTTEEYYEVLKAFKTEDPNGNGKADEIPLAGSPDNWYGNIVSSGGGFLMNSFIYSKVHVKNDEIVVPFNKPEWKEGIEYLHKLYAEGLIYQESFNQSREQIIRLGDNREEVKLGTVPAATRSSFVNIQSDRGEGYTTIPPLEGPKGNIVAMNDPDIVGGNDFVMSKDAEYPDVAFRLADAMYEWETTMRLTKGVLGEDWREAEEGEMGLNGEPAEYTSLGKSGGDLQNNHWDQTGVTYRPKEIRESETAGKNDQEAVLFQETLKYEPYLSEETIALPTMFFDEQQSSRLATLGSNVNDYVDEMTAKFIVGNADIDKKWDEYITNLQNIGIEEYEEIYQEAYDAMNEN